jgi:hypothetical protein
MTNACMIIAGGARWGEARLNIEENLVFKRRHLISGDQYSDTW